MGPHTLATGPQDWILDFTSKPQKLAHTHQQSDT